MIKIFHHNDLDGRMAAALVYEYYKHIVVVSDEEIKFFEVDYNMDLNEINEICSEDMFIFVDYSFSSKKNTEYLTNVMSSGAHVVWIDHHATSMGLIDKVNNPELYDIYNEFKDNIELVLNTDKCASVLTYLYYKDKVDALMEEHVENKTVPYIIEYVNSHDLWLFNMNNTEEFVLGIGSLEYNPKNILNMVIGRESHAHCYNIYNNDKYMKIRDREYQFIQNMINMGSNIKIYKTRQNTIERDFCGFEFTILLSTKDMERRYSGFAMNIHGNSSVFGDKVNDYDVVCPFIKTKNGVWKYSLFTAKDNVDCSAIASVMACLDYLGGGGHVKAAGFQTKSCIFDKGTFIKILPGKYNYKILIESEDKE